jgi:hypothetical protein
MTPLWGKRKKEKRVGEKEKKKHGNKKSRRLVRLRICAQRKASRRRRGVAIFERISLQTSKYFKTQTSALSFSGFLVTANAAPVEIFRFMLIDQILDWLKHNDRAKLSHHEVVMGNPVASQWGQLKLS